MTVRKILCGAALYALSLPFFACASSNDPVQGDSSGYWSSGVLVGQKGTVASKGLLFPTKEMTFLLGSEPYSGDRNYVPKKVRVSTYEKTVFDKLLSLPVDEPVILRYVHPHPMNLFHWTHSKYFVMQAGRAGRDFAKTRSWDKHGYEFHEPFHSHHGRWEGGRKSGKVIHVSRWGTGLFGKTCTAWLHEGGTKQIFVTKYRTYTYERFNPNTGKNEPVTREEPCDETVSIPNVSRLNIYSESGCSFAEDAALSMASVSVDYSRALFEIWNKYGLTIHSIHVEKQGNHSFDDTALRPSD